MENRQQRLGELLKKEISDLVLREIKDPRIGFVSVTLVEVTADLRHASVYVSVLGSEKERQGTLAGLRSATGFIKRELGRRLRLKYIPDVTFKYDKSLEEGARILALIDQVVQEKSNGSDDE